MNVKSVKSSELRQGDVVVTYGMRVLLDEAIREYPDAQYGPVFACRGLVLNPDEVKAARIIPFGWLLDKVWVDGKGWTNEPRWTIQGNDLASWAVDRLTDGEWDRLPAATRNLLDPGSDEGPVYHHPVK